MYKKIFVLFVVLVLVISLSYLYVYDKRELEKNSNDSLIIKNDEEIVQDYEEELTKNFIEENTYEEVEEQRKAEEEDILGTLVIEKINLTGKVKEGSTDDILEEYIGHIENTEQYNGNVGLAAHNRGNDYPYFARLNELEIGDEIIYKTEYGKRTYVVKNKVEILDTDWSLLENTEENKLTLITCINNRVNQRLCVQAVQKDM